jgi:hypothetical protein
MSFTASAGFKKGNGGNSVVCPDHTELLDFYEAGILDNYEFENSTKSWEVILEEKLNLLARAKPDLAKKYQNWLKQFNREVLFLVDVNLGKVNDSLHVIIPDGCTVEQTVNQQSTPLPVEKRYWVSKKHWDNLSSLNKAGLIFHEFTYREMQSKDSREVRHITAFVFSKGFDQLTVDEINSEF